MTRARLSSHERVVTKADSHTEAIEKHYEDGTWQSVANNQWEQIFHRGKRLIFTMTNHKLFIGCAGWQLTPHHDLFGPGESVLERYATRFNAVEINSTFRKVHQRKTFTRWANTVPDNFRFSVKTPREITHENKLRDCTPLLENFIDAVTGLGTKLGPILIQLPPSFQFDPEIAMSFFWQMRKLFDGPIVLEPRHASWTGGSATELLANFQIDRVIADPPPFPDYKVNATDHGVEYHRLHGSPDMYYSAYTDSFLTDRATQLAKATAGERWCIFDNTARGHSISNALSLMKRPNLVGPAMRTPSFDSGNYQT